MTRYWCEYAWLGDRPAAGTLIEVTNGRITSVAPGVPDAPPDPPPDPPPDATRLLGLTLPGLANAHSQW